MKPSGGLRRVHLVKPPRERTCSARSTFPHQTPAHVDADEDRDRDGNKDERGPKIRLPDDQDEGPRKDGSLLAALVVVGLGSVLWLRARCGAWRPAALCAGAVVSLVAVPLML